MGRSYQDDNNYVALIPAAGRGTRISPSPCSKEIYPVGWQTWNGKKRPKVISQYLLESLRGAGVYNAVMVIRKGKWDIPNYYGDGLYLNMGIAYVVVEPTKGHPFTLEKAKSFIKGSNVALGFPDIYFEPENAFSVLMSEFKRSKPDVVLGLFPISNGKLWDVVKTDKYGAVTDIQLRGSSKVERGYTWIMTIWTPDFTRFMTDYLNNITDLQLEQEELMLDHIFLAALKDGLSIKAVQFDVGKFLDIGTSQGLEAIAKLNMDEILES